jgi:superfamily I DNA and/or RNA helicase
MILALNEDHSKLMEECLIEIFGRRDLGTGTLLNFTNGGDGRKQWSDEQKLEHSRKLTGQKRSAKTKQQMSASAKARMLRLGPPKGSPNGGRRKGCETSDEHRQKLSKAQTGKKHSPETIEKMKASHLKRKLAKVGP